MNTQKKQKTVWFGMKLTPNQKEKIQLLARRHGMSQKHIVLDLIDRAMDKEIIEARPGSFLDRNRDLFGTSEGPSDGSTNPDYMKDYGR